ncbi:cytidine deaminase [Haloimpatiens sp. FM7315]|uniref:cytidine deaminase n=1 Tax=Haloimpatiens sp. FM7315 TaxID=3298609 RepID=UPI00370B18C2
MTVRELILKAKEARKKSYSPYSNFKVGAAVLMKTGKVYTGCNIENASYGATNCAERTAIFSAISDEMSKIDTLALIGSETEFTYPCGICRQVISEFADEETKIIIAKNENEYIEKKLEDIIPGTFTKDDLNK